MEKICLISCVQQKKDTQSPASSLYVSSLFKKTSAYASKKFDRWFILSAKYGLLRPEQLIEPYDLSLNKMSSERRKQWAQTVFGQILNFTSIDDEITILAGERYREDLVPLLASSGYRVLVPMEGLSIGNQLKWLNNALKSDFYEDHLNCFYDLLAYLSNGLSGPHILSQCSGNYPWPKRGVYFFFEPGEMRRFFPDVPRVVRVGTHSVSKGSQSTLWNRIRTHRGTDMGLGNHRSSIFRLHIGAAMQARESHIHVPSWGVNQISSSDVVRNEEILERSVSEYIRNMSILWLAIDDEPSPRSDRAFIERNSIGLITRGKNTYDPPSPNWLGLHSPSGIIQNSGLWNIDYVNSGCSDSFLDVFEKYVEFTIGKRKLKKKSLAPPGWYLDHSKREMKGQLKFF